MEARQMLALKNPLKSEQAVPISRYMVWAVGRHKEPTGINNGEPPVKWFTRNMDVAQIQCPERGDSRKEYIW